MFHRRQALEWNVLRPEFFLLAGVVILLLETDLVLWLWVLHIHLMSLLKLAWQCPWLILWSIRSFLIRIISTIGSQSNLLKSLTEFSWVSASKISLAHRFCSLRTLWRLSTVQLPQTVQQYSSIAFMRASNNNNSEDLYYLNVAKRGMSYSMGCFHSRDQWAFVWRRPRFTNFSCLQWQHRERIETPSVNYSLCHPWISSLF